MKKLLYVIVILLLIISLVGVTAYFWYDDAVNNPVSNSAESVGIQVNEGDTFSNLVATLETEGLIKSATAAKIYIQLNDVTPQLKVGYYEIPKNLNLIEVIELLEKGSLKEAVSVTIKEGQSIQYVADAVAENLPNSNFSKVEFVDIANNPDRYTFKPVVQEFLNENKPVGASLLGYIYPDTYFIDTDMSAIMVLEFMVENLITKLEANELLPFEGSVNGEISTLHEAITLASIIEREASSKDDRSMISGVFHNRLIDNYLLQADSTVNFITGKNDAGVLIADTKIDNPYNTYLYPGLPPGPINNPRIESIIAAVKPAQTEFYFFIHDPEGNSYFARTQGEHEQNIVNYL